MADAGKPKGTGEEGKVPRPDKSNTASKGMAEQPKGGNAGAAETDDEEDEIMRSEHEGSTPRAQTM